MGTQSGATVIESENGLPAPAPAVFAAASTVYVPAASARDMEEFVPLPESSSSATAAPDVAVPLRRYMYVSVDEASARVARWDAPPSVNV